VKRGLLTSFQYPLGIHKPVELDGLGHQPGPADLVAGKLPTELIDVAMRNLGVQVVWCDSYRDVCRKYSVPQEERREIDFGPRSSYSSTSWTPDVAAARRRSASVVAKGSLRCMASAKYAAS
jgi:hypothetical protein